MDPLDGLLQECVDTCRVMRRAFRGLVRRNVEYVCRAHNIDDPKVIDELVDKTIEKLNHL